MPCSSAVCAVALLGWLQSRPVTATASSTFPRYTLVYLAENLLDGSPLTQWMPPGERAWVDIALGRPRILRRVSVTNGDNAPHRDQSTRDFRVELYLGDALVHAASDRFETVSTDTRWIDVGGARADRIRVTIESWHQRGGCLADVGWDEAP